MKKIIPKFLRSKWGGVAVIACIGLYVFSFYSPNQMILYREYPLSFNTDVKQHFDLWEKEGVQTRPLYILPSLFFFLGGEAGFSVPLSQATMFYLLIITGGIGVFLLLRKIMKEKNNLIPLLAGVFYISSSYLLLSLNFLALQWFLGFLPLWMWLMYGLIESGYRQKYINGLIITSPVLSIISTNITLVIGTAMVLGLTALIKLAGGTSSSRSIPVKAAVFSGIAFLVINSWWIYTHSIILGDIITSSIADKEERILTDLNEQAIHPLAQFFFNVYQIDPNQNEVIEFSTISLNHTISPFILFYFTFIVLTLVFLLLKKQTVSRKHGIILASFLIIVGLFWLLEKEAEEKGVDLFFNLLPNTGFLNGHLITFIIILLPVLAIAVGLMMEEIQARWKNTKNAIMSRLHYLYLPAMAFIFMVGVYIQVSSWHTSLPDQEDPTVVSLKSDIRPLSSEFAEWMKEKENKSIIFISDKDPKKLTLHYKDSLFNLPNNQELFIPTNQVEFLLKNTYKNILLNKEERVVFLMDSLNTKNILVEKNEDGQPVAPDIIHSIERFPSLEKIKDFDEGAIYAIKKSEVLENNIIAPARRIYFLSNIEKDIVHFVNFSEIDADSTLIHVEPTKNNFQNLLTLRNNVLFGMDEKIDPNQMENGADSTSKTYTTYILQDNEYLIYHKRMEVAYYMEEKDGKQRVVIEKPYWVSGAYKDDKDNSHKILWSHEIQNPKNKPLQNLFFIRTDNAEEKFIISQEPRLMIMDEKDFIGELQYELEQPAKIFNSSSETLVDTGTVTDCHNYDDREREDVGINASLVTDGDDEKQFLQLETREHIGCISRGGIAVKPLIQYEIKTSYKQLTSVGLAQISVIERTDNREYITTYSLPKSRYAWQNFQKEFISSRDVKEIDIVFKIIGDDKKLTSKVIFGDLQLIQKTQGIQPLRVNINQIPERIRLTSSKNEFSLDSNIYAINLEGIDPSFENGSWVEKIGDCNNFNQQSLEKSGIEAVQDLDATDKEFSLKLSAGDHLACSTQILNNVVSGVLYNFSIDYKNISATGPARLRLASGRTILFDENLPMSEEWTTFETSFQIPRLNEDITLILMTEGNGEGVNTNLFDNIQIKRVGTPLAKNIIITTKDAKISTETKLPAVNSEKINSAKYKVYVRNEEKPFFLVFLTPYNKDWHAYTPVKSDPNASIIKKLWHKTKKSKIKEDFHLQAQGYANSWYIEKPGEYEIFIEYRPQQYFQFLLIAAMIAWFSLIGWLTYDTARKKE